MNLGPLKPMTKDEILNRHAEWHGKPPTEREVQNLLQSMLDALDGIPPLKREVIDEHLIHRRIPRSEMMRDFFYPVVIVGLSWGLWGLFW